MGTLETARINGMKGGRPKGSKLPATIEKEAVLKAFREKVMRSADVLYASQLHLAKGQTFLYKIEKEVIIGPKGGKTIRSKPAKQVTSQSEIESYLQRVVDENNGEAEPLDREDTYYFITVKEPSNMAADSLFDRAFGKSVQSVDLSVQSGKLLFGDEEKNKSQKAIGEYIADHTK